VALWPLSSVIASVRPVAASASLSVASLALPWLDGVNW
jgi:hypothetical protein